MKQINVHKRALQPIHGFIYVVNLALRKKGSDFQKSSFLFPFSKVEVDCI